MAHADLCENAHQEKSHPPDVPKMTSHTMFTAGAAAALLCCCQLNTSCAAAGPPKQRRLVGTSNTSGTATAGAAAPAQLENAGAAPVLPIASSNLQSSAPAPAACETPQHRRRWPAAQRAPRTPRHLQSGGEGTHAGWPVDKTAGAHALVSSYSHRNTAQAGAVLPAHPAAPSCAAPIQRHRAATRGCLHPPPPGQVPPAGPQTAGRFGRVAGGVAGRSWRFTLPVQLGWQSGAHAHKQQPTEWQCTRRRTHKKAQPHAAAGQAAAARQAHLRVHCGGRQQQRGDLAVLRRPAAQMAGCSAAWWEREIHGA